MDADSSLPMLENIWEQMEKPRRSYRHNSRRDPRNRCSSDRPSRPWTLEKGSSSKREKTSHLAPHNPNPRIFSPGQSWGNSCFTTADAGS